MGSVRVPGGTVDKLPADLRAALVADAAVLEVWQDITPLARNEFICWVEDAKQATTRARRIRRTREELEAGQRRPCCWPGCKHRTRYGGALAAGVFLQEFVADDIPCAHLDIAGPAGASEVDGGLVKGGTGFGVRTLVDLCTTFAKPKAGER